jgi:hypothetical protein
VPCGLIERWNREMEPPISMSAAGAAVSVME